MQSSIVEISRCFAYTRWAHGKTRESVAGLTEEEYERPLGGSFGSIQGTLAHLCGADWVWLERLSGRSPRALLPAESVATRDALKIEWTGIEDGLRRYVEALTPERLSEPIRYLNFAGEEWTYAVSDALFHVANHGTYHRGQIATLLRQLGREPVSTDYLRFIDAGE